MRFSIATLVVLLDVCCFRATVEALNLDEPGWHTVHFNVSDVDRRAHVYVPSSGRPSEGWTLTMAIHGWGDNCDTFCMGKDFLSATETGDFPGGVQTYADGEAESRGQLLICPCGLSGGKLGRTAWNAGVCCQRQSVNDFDYFSVLLNALADAAEGEAEPSCPSSSTRPFSLPVHPELQAQSRTEEQERVNQLIETAKDGEADKEGLVLQGDLQTKSPLCGEKDGGPRPLPFRRVFGAGFSNGGFMVKALECLWPDLFDATTAVSAVTVLRPGGTSGISQCDQLHEARKSALAEGATAWRRAKSVKGMALTGTSTLEVHGTFDPLVPVFGDPLLSFPSVWNDQAAVLKRQACDPSSKEQTLKSKSWSNEEYKHCTCGLEVEDAVGFPQVEFVRNSKGVHHWYLTEDFNTTKYLFDFFDRVAPPPSSSNSSFAFSLKTTEAKEAGESVSLSPVRRLAIRGGQVGSDDSWGVPETVQYT